MQFESCEGHHCLMRTAEFESSVDRQPPLCSWLQRAAALRASARGNAGTADMPAGRDLDVAGGIVPLSRNNAQDGRGANVFLNTMRPRAASFALCPTSMSRTRSGTRVSIPLRGGSLGYQHIGN